MTGTRPGRAKATFRSSWRFGLGLLGVVVFLVVLVQVLARLTIFLSEAGRPEAAEPAAVTEPDRRPAGQVKTHRVAEWPADKPRRFNEAPMLARLVAAKKLPPVKERLPENPLVIIPPDQNGPYGGTWARYGIGPGDVGIYRHRLTYEGLVRWGPMGRKILPNLAWRWDISDDATTYTFYLRRGVRWSDGVPFTADDILFWYHDVLKNKDLTPRVPPELRRGEEVVEVEKVDDFTVRFRFAEPYGLFLKKVASGIGYEMLNYPAHYLKRFHPKYTSKEELDRRLKKSRFDFWYQLFRAKGSWRNPDIPRLWAWIITKPPPAQPAECTRNPYYWKVDPEGNQLPYIDKISFEIYDTETINLKVINGEAGMQGRHLYFENYQLFMANRAKGGYRVLHWIDGGVGTLALCPNLNHKNPVLRKIINDRRFRIALSLAIDRREMNEAFYFGVGKPRQVAPPRISKYYVADYENAYVDYNPAEANRLLDEMGLDKRNLEGIRLRPDGKLLDLTIETSTNVKGAKLLEMVAEYWREVGIKTNFKLEARQLFAVRRKAMLHDVGVWKGQGEIIPVLDPRFFFPYSNASLQAIGWARWYRSGGKKGIEPPPEVKECIRLYKEIEKTANEAEQIRLFKKIIELNRQNLWVIGTIGDIPQIFVVQNRFRNVPEVAVASWVVRSPGNTAPECYAIAEEK